LLCASVGLQIDFPAAHHFGDFRVVVRQEEGVPRIEGLDAFHVVRVELEVEDVEVFDDSLRTNLGMTTILR